MLGFPVSSPRRPLQQPKPQVPTRTPTQGAADVLLLLQPSHSRASATAPSLPGTTPPRAESEEGKLCYSLHYLLQPATAYTEDTSSATPYTLLASPGPIMATGPLMATGPTRMLAPPIMPCHVREYTAMSASATKHTKATVRYRTTKC